ncbi:MaoC/PaaZ C-terminal domain-containing protein [Streptomyces sp. NPDC057363]|uniref:MaoC/PaaZ C-terminal domain-containing protein n=1 Tax=Streptomyces sp. NPDC057363 TaxID=3346107 RepID=UPI003636C0D6
MSKIGEQVEVQTQERVFEVGAALPAFVRRADLATWNRYAAVNDEFVAIHMDDEAGRAAGYPGAIGMGNLIWAWLHAMIEDWLGDRGRLDRMECRFRGPALKGDEISCAGTVLSREVSEGGAVVLELDVWADRQTGERLVAAKARVLIPA